MKPTIADLKAADKTLMALRLAARLDGRRSDAQQLSDTQFLLREAVKLEQRAAAIKERPKNNPTPYCYVIMAHTGTQVAYGASVDAAWQAAEEFMGSKRDFMVELGYECLTGKFHPVEGFKPKKRKRKR